MKDIEFFWIDDENKVSVFNQCATITSGYEGEPTVGSLNLDVLLIYKKTTLKKIIDFILSDWIVSDTSTIAKIRNFVSCVVLFSLSPMTSNFLTSQQNEFRMIFSIFEKSRGEWFVSKKRIDKLEIDPEVIDLLIVNKLLVEYKESYHVVGYILKNLEIR